MDPNRLHAEIEEVVRRGNCSGCGACALLDKDVVLELADNGFIRPRIGVSGPSDTDPTALAEFRQSCPGVSVQAQRPVGTRRHDFLGPIVSIWEAYALDEDIRFKGSSGGTLTALNEWLVATGQIDSVVVAAASESNPAKTETSSVRTRADIVRATGSRYAPTASAAAADMDNPASAVVGKPCEVAALRALAKSRDQQSPLMLSFFCAGVPSQHATESLIHDLGVDDGAEVATVRYRGHGWPGDFYVEDAHGNSVRTSYDVSWGKHLGPAVQQRCKLCPDGVGESADISAGDFWRTDSSGYPDFTDQDGLSVLIARTRRGEDVIRRAAEEGVIAISAIDPDAVADVQPFQVVRRATLLGRMAGSRLAGHAAPRYRGFRLWRLSLRAPLRTLRAVAGTFRRARRW
ncbi:MULTISPECIES: Coenzyme F420 hydrogenase/dehydrogenase, beta subunit C-terminal domain [unclassified Rhodococcus (in: high G+C Gram-positive bacteria)]|uniref:Coenzyme F420 hydrogenase/dehydrogenase, beta subunit C-terminal domain n=1 Tax=unclassified Rhodococcus (in: high G+C Gram-positive bacteria) TaxID=192944 RepID=UPI00163B4EE8|nr:MULTISPECIES: Coenzyme F420 hydrogenase/dehydrogenase, beta subunit C-terminal domain [unclassified Rhodococcus (in: high G+C Gram-positive bacteria)]MBC2642689.1 Coenzyme F420 hydrogenase/dehydrogenase, beta subunit C-terminal domain [Rhodococcus sp. 3A]MBC2892569.1 Coenzyme F420 hydrogenase/dehydrogenase, beta subunit C-terminal domain [Rhodococcus sp. 4CII]